MVLVGLMGSGKTTVGRLLAARLRRPFLDSDEQVETRTGRTVREIFEVDGEPAFRELEAAALVDAVHRPTPAVIAAAGGVVLDAGNRALLRSAGTVVWLRVAAGQLVDRAVAGLHRPLIAEDPEGVLLQMEADRRHLYEEVAHHVVDAGDRSPEELVDAIEAVVG